MTMKQLHIKKRLAWVVWVLPLALMVLGGCGGDDDDTPKAPADLVKELEGTYDVDYTLTATSDVIVPGLTGPQQTGKGELVIAAASDNASELVLTLTITGSTTLLTYNGQAALSANNLTLKARAGDVKEQTGSTRYTVKSATIKAENLGGTEVPLSGIMIPQTSQNTTHSYSGDLSISDALLKAVLPDALYTAIKGVLGKARKTALVVDLNVGVQNAVKK